MKILMLAPYIYNPKIKAFAKNKSGFGMMVHSIAEAIARSGCDVEMLTNAFTKEINDSYTYIRHTPFSVMFKSRLRGVRRYLKSNKEAITSFKDKLKHIYYYLNLGFVENYIKKSMPDVVHIHGMGGLSSVYVDICKKLNVPCCVTAHGLLENDVDASDFGRVQEKALFSKLERENINVSVISSGILHRLTNNHYGLQSLDNVTVICNGTDVKQYDAKENIKEKYNIPNDSKVVICIGSVLKRKNQIQILNAYEKMGITLKEKTFLIFAGVIDKSYPMKERVEELGIEDHVRLLGFVPHEDLPSYYHSADVVALASIDEGFGLSLIEGMVYGVPFVTFSDLDAVEDICNEDVCVLSQNRDDETFAKAIEESLSKKWDKEKIIEYSKTFSFENMAKNYIEFYRKTIKDHSV